MSENTQSEKNKGFSYKEKLEIADKYLNEKCGIDWDDLPDINSLHDADTEKDIIDLCEERLSELMN